MEFRYTMHIMNIKENNELDNTAQTAEVEEWGVCTVFLQLVTTTSDTVRHASILQLQTQQSQRRNCTKQSTCWYYRRTHTPSKQSCSLVYITWLGSHVCCQTFLRALFEDKNMPGHFKRSTATCIKQVLTWALLLNFNVKAICLMSWWLC